MKRILVINPFGIGDVIFSMSLVEAIRQADPKAVIGFLCNERTVDLVRLNTSIDHTFVFHRDLFRRLWRKSPLLFFKKLKALLAMIREHRFDTVFDLSLGREFSFFCRWVGIKRSIGFDYQGRGLFLTDKIRMDGYSGAFVAVTQLELLTKTGISYDTAKSFLPFQISSGARQDALDLLTKQGVAGEERLIALAPGGGKSWGKQAVYKQWDSERFAEAANVFCKGGRFRIVLLGDAREQGLLQRTASCLRVPVVMAAGEAIEKVCALLLRTEFLLCNDGGLLHLANALGVKTVSIFGPVDEKVYGPLGGRSAREVVTEPVPCRPCYQRFHFPPCPYERRCLGELSVDKVVAAMKKVNERAPKAPVEGS
ncbi:MAG: hypothetical protein COT00_02645 [Candidatus Omnitrophica bacterium CG07_land_8_20_14_0_80_50_8]|nr:MAG: hypothetical protein COT00_02645 [Candidatus Omnitrophica bacterium CG07_land_8_20_14_0_80_50_8]